MKPNIDIFLPVCGEGLAVLSNTWRGVAEVIEHYRGTVTAWVLDDAADSNTEALAMSYGFNYRVRPDRPHLKKAGNLRSAFNVTDGKYILILDADFRPIAEILDHMLPYLELNPSLAIVQSPQYFRITPGQTHIQRGAAYVQELYYRLIQVVRQHYGAANCVGSCALYRREALAQMGGTAPRHHSEDLWTGVMVQSLGWDPVEYIPLALTSGLCPDTVKAFYNQQYRWCAGTLSLIRSREFWYDLKIGLAARYFYVQGFLYYAVTSALYLLYPVMGVYISLRLPDQIANYLFFTYFIKFVSEAGLLIFWTRAPFGSYYFLARYVAYTSHVLAIWDALLSKTMEWVPTGAVRGGTGYGRFIYLALGFPNMILICYMAAALLPAENTLVMYSRWALVVQQIIAMCYTIYPIIDEDGILAGHAARIFRRIGEMIRHMPRIL